MSPRTKIYFLILIASFLIPGVADAAHLIKFEGPSYFNDASCAGSSQGFDTYICDTPNSHSIGDCFLKDSSNPGASTIYNFYLKVEDKYQDDYCTALEHYYLSISKKGKGSGIVTAEPAGRSCGNDCFEYNYDEETRVVLTAVPATTSQFAGWTNCTPTIASALQCVVTMDSDKTITAQFDPAIPAPAPFPVLSVSVSGDGSVTGGGIDCPGACENEYPLNETVTLTAQPASDSTFGRWGNCTPTSGKPLECVVTMNSDKNVVASFIVATQDTETNDTETTTKTAGEGQTVTTDTSGDGATNDDTVETTIEVPEVQTGTVDITVEERRVTRSAPAGTTFISRQVNINISSPPAAGKFFTVNFRLHSSLFPPNVGNTIRVFKDGNPIAFSCSGIDPTQKPCLASVQWVGEEVTLVVRTPSASEWNFAFPEAVAATGLVPCGQTPANPCQLCDVFVLGHNIVEWILVIAVPILAALLFAWGGFTWLTSAGNPGRVKQGQQILFATVVGILIVYGAWLFVNLLLQSLGAATFDGSGGFDKWWEIDCPVAVSPPIPVPVGAPTVSLSISSNSILEGSAATLSWVTGNSPTSCTGDWPVAGSSKNPAGGSESVSPSAGNYTYTIACTNSDGSDNDSTALVVTSVAPSLAVSGTVAPSSGFPGLSGVQVKAEVTNNNPAETTTFLAECNDAANTILGPTIVPAGTTNITFTGTCGPYTNTVPIRVEAQQPSSAVIPEDLLNVTIASLPTKRVFVTSTEYDGGWNTDVTNPGLAQALADLECNNHSSAAGIGFAYNAWLSAEHSLAGPRHARDHVSDGNYETVDGLPIAPSKAVLIDSSINLLNPIDRDEFGNKISGNFNVWTDTGSNGMVFLSSRDCETWTSSDSSQSGRVGRADRTDSTWTSSNDRTCDQTARLYCFEQ